MPEQSDLITEEALRLRTEQASDDEYTLLLRVIATWELSSFVPAKKQRKTALKSLAAAFGGRESARRAAELLLESEQSAECPESSVENCDCTARLRRLAAKLGRTPLRAEVSEPDMVHIQRCHGGWRNALALANLKALEGDALEKALHGYMLANASPDFLGDDIKNKLSEADVRELLRICDMARSMGRAPVRGDIPEKFFHSINSSCGSWRAVMVHMGLSPLDKKTDRKLSRKVLRRRASKKKKEGNTPFGTDKL
ncbi:MAG: hypothetical protein LBK57_04550 [Clostridiales Family XIII bacterium]|jgi:hypothetical protein|nr:hypothetical protein [Clostridiales Family XIII bacterium]